MTTIYIVLAQEIESASVVRAFTTEDAAKAFRELCRAADEKQPMVPDIECSNAEYDKWNRRHRKWEKKHPAGEHYAASEYAIVETELAE